MFLEILHVKCQFINSIKAQIGCFDVQQKCEFCLLCSVELCTVKWKVMQKRGKLDKKATIELYKLCLSVQSHVTINDCCFWHVATKVKSSQKMIKQFDFRN